MMRAKESTLSLPKFRERLVARGYQEAITYSFVDSQVQSMMEPEAETIRLANPISSNMDVMRSHLWPGLLQALLHNTKRQQTRLRLFETGLTFKNHQGNLLQNKVISGIASGPAFPEQWGEPERDVDFFDVKSDVEALLGTWQSDDAFNFVPVAHPALHPGQAARIERNGRDVGLLGAVHPRIVRALKLAGPAFVFELSLKDVQEGHVPRFEGLSKFPSVRRDIAIIFDESVSAQAVKDCVGQTAGGMLNKLEFFDVYRGESIDSGKKSLAISLTFQATSRTLNDKEVDALVMEIVGALTDELSGRLRGDMWH
jgi:phenylalanyl-tRNA synthetase beta chain